MKYLLITALLFCSTVYADDLCRNPELQQFIRNVNQDGSVLFEEKIIIEPMRCQNGAIEFYFSLNPDNPKADDEKYVSDFFEHFYTGIKRKYCNILKDNSVPYLHNNWRIYFHSPKLKHSFRGRLDIQSCSQFDFLH